MLVLGIITVILGSAIYMMAGNLDAAKIQRTDGDFQTIESSLRLYEMSNRTFPTTAQGLDALVDKPTSEPLPRRWTRIMTAVPKDPWQVDYGYFYPGKRNPASFDIYSFGPDKVEGTEDDIYPGN
jgi:general secretion pathway protein G